MKYRNRKTGWVIDIDSILEGGDWERVETKKAETSEQTKRRSKPKKEED